MYLFHVFKKNVYYRIATTPRNSLTTRSKKVNLFDFDDQLLKLLSNCDESIILEPEKFKVNSKKNYD